MSDIKNKTYTFKGETKEDPYSNLASLLLKIGRIRGATCKPPRKRESEGGREGGRERGREGRRERRRSIPG